MDNGLLQSLLKELTAKLDNRFPLRQTDGTPVSPMIILYMGEKAKKAECDITAALRKTWRARTAGVIPQLVYLDGGEKNESGIARIQTEDASQIDMDEYAMEDMVDEVQEHEECFRKMQELLICTVESVEDCSILDDFKTKFSAVENLWGESWARGCRMIRFVLLDESARGRKLSSEVRGFLCETIMERYKNNEVFVVLSNRLRGGALLRKNRIRQNYQLIGSLIVLANSEGSEYRNGIDLFLTGNQGHVLTAAYSRLARPNAKIVEIVLQTTVKWIQSHMKREVFLDNTDICRKLCVSGGSMQFIEHFFKCNASQSLPPAEVLEYLPRRSNKMNGLLQMSFKAFQQETFGVYDAFIDRLSVFDTSAIDCFRREFRIFLEENITEPEAANSLTDTNIKNLLWELKREAPADTVSAAAYMQSYMKYAFLERILPVIEDEMKKYREEAKGHVNLLDQLMETLQDISTLVADDAQLKSFYSGLTESFLNGSYGEELLEAYGKCEGDLQAFCNLVRSMFDALMTSNRIFSLPLEEELAERMDGDRNSMRVVNNELLSGIDDRTRLETLSPLSSYFQIILGNRFDGNGYATTIAKHLEQSLEAIHTFKYFDTGDRNLFEAIVFYRVEAVNLLKD